MSNRDSDRERRTIRAQRAARARNARARERTARDPKIHPSLGDCPGCGKQMFATRRVAKQQADRLHPDGRLDAYPCTVHQRAGERVWHLGHLPDGVRSGEISRDDLAPPSMRVQDDRHSPKRRVSQDRKPRPPRNGEMRGADLECTCHRRPHLLICATVLGYVFPEPPSA